MPAQKNIDFSLIIDQFADLEGVYNMLDWVFDCDAEVIDQKSYGKHKTERNIIVSIPADYDLAFIVSELLKHSFICNYNINTCDSGLTFYHIGY